MRDFINTESVASWLRKRIIVLSVDESQYFTLSEIVEKDVRKAVEAAYALGYEDGRKHAASKANPK